MPPANTLGPVLLITRDHRCASRVEMLLTRERFTIRSVHRSDEALRVAASDEPTVILLDWEWDELPSREELVYRLRPRRAGPRVLAIASDRDALAAGNLSGVRGVLGRVLDAEEVTDLVWRCHHEVVDARKTE